MKTNDFDDLLMLWYQFEIADNQQLSKEHQVAAKAVGKFISDLTLMEKATVGFYCRNKLLSKPNRDNLIFVSAKSKLYKNFVKFNLLSE